jgi:hypothetical protein
MTATQNNFLGPAALIFSCCFPANTGWESENCGLGAAHELSIARSLPINDAVAAHETVFDRIRAANRAGARTLRIF